MKKEYVYHRVVDDMRGDILYPLNQLKTLFPDVYNIHVRKYTGREALLETVIPILNCLWNDVLHFTAVHPEDLLNNLKIAGFVAEELVWKKWFKVPIDLFNFENVVVCMYRRDISFIPDARSFSGFNSKNMEEYRMIPLETIEYYKQQKSLGQKPLFFHRIPHVLYKGIVNTKNLEIIEV